MSKYPVVLSASLSLIAGCIENQSVEVSGSGIIVDSVQVDMVYDATPGFPYPMMHHDLSFRARIAHTGAISYFDYTSGDVEMGLSIDASPVAAWTPWRFSDHVWSASLLPPGTAVAYNLTVVADLVDRTTAKFQSSGVSTVVQESDGPRPDPLSVQLTGPSSWNYSPTVSGDGERIYFESNPSPGSPDRNICRIPTSGGTAEVLVRVRGGRWNLGGFTLIENDSKLLYLLWNGGVESRIVQRDLATGGEDTLSVPIGLWDGPLYQIPASQRILAVTYPSADSLFNSDIVVVDLLTGRIDTLVVGQPYQVFAHVALRPHTRQVSFGLTGDSSTIRISLFDVDTRAVSSFAKLQGKAFSWAANGTDYAVIRDLGWGVFGTRTQNVFVTRSGVESRITSYPGEDWGVCFFPGNSQIVFSSFRRGEWQIWSAIL